MVRSAVGSVNANKDSNALAVDHSKTRGEAHWISAPERVTEPVDVRPVRPVTSPAEETSQEVVSMARVFAPQPIVTAPVEDPVLIPVVKLELVLIVVAAPEIVAPAEAVRRVLNVFAPPIV